MQSVRGRLLLLPAVGVLACGEVADVTPVAARAEQIQRGTTLSPSAALSAGIVETIALSASASTGKLGEACSGTMIGPRLLLTAEHCVRDRDPGTGKWGKLEKTIKVSVPGATGAPALWASSECALSPGTVGS